MCGEFINNFEPGNIRMFVADFSGPVLAHCHTLPHEDEGMMGTFYVLIESQGNGIVPSPSPASLPTALCLNDLVGRPASSNNTLSPVVTSLFDYQFDEHHGIWTLSIIAIVDIMQYICDISIKKRDLE